MYSRRVRSGVTNVVIVTAFQPGAYLPLATATGPMRALRVAGNPLVRGLCGARLLVNVNVGGSWRVDDTSFRADGTCALPLRSPKVKPCGCGELGVRRRPYFARVTG